MASGACCDDPLAVPDHTTLVAEKPGWLPLFNARPTVWGRPAASLILSIVLLPLIRSLSREALLLVPDSQREAMLALGATRWEVMRQAVIPYARSGILSARSCSTPCVAI